MKLRVRMLKMNFKIVSTFLNSEMMGTQKKSIRIRRPNVEIYSLKDKLKAL